MKRKLIYLDDLYQYCMDNKIFCFHADNDDEEVIAYINATLEVFDEETKEEEELRLRLKACHTGKNTKSTYISVDTMKKAMPTFVEKPILASIVEVTDENENATLDFNGHDMKITSDKMNPDQVRIEYIETMVGVIPQNCNMQLDEEADSKGRRYLHVDGIVYRNYSYACDILEKRKTVNVSIEIAVSDFSYNAKKHYLEINEFKFRGITLLGSSKNPGMAHASASIQDFSLCTENISKEFNMKGGESMDITKLLAKYKIAKEDISFEYEGLTETEIEKLFKETFEKDTNSNSDTGSITGTDDSNISSACKNAIQFTIRKNDELLSEFEVFMNDACEILWKLVQDTHGENDGVYYSVTAYESYVIMESYYTRKAFRQSYSSKDNVYTLIGERVEVFRHWLSKEEEEALAALQSNYSNLEEKVRNHELETLRAEKIELMNQEKYSILKKDAAFQNLKENMDSYSTEDFSKELKVAYSDFIDLNPELILSRKDKPTVRKKIAYGFEFDKEEKPYGTLFEK